MTYLKTSFGAVLRNNADVWRVHTGTNKRVQVIVPQVSHLKTKEKMDLRLSEQNSRYTHSILPALMTHLSFHLQNSSLATKFYICPGVKKNILAIFLLKHTSYHTHSLHWCFVWTKLISPQPLSYPVILANRGLSKK